MDPFRQLSIKTEPVVEVKNEPVDCDEYYIKSEVCDIEDFEESSSEHSSVKEENDSTHIKLESSTDETLFCPPIKNAPTQNPFNEMNCAALQSISQSLKEINVEMKKMSAALIKLANKNNPAH